jgi:hypothetical protein
MNLDIRIPIGLLFITLGVLLTGFGVISDRAIYARSLDFNINLWWGLVLLAFGGAMAFFGFRAPAGKPAGADEVAPPRGQH